MPDSRSDHLTKRVSMDSSSFVFKPGIGVVQLPTFTKYEAVVPVYSAVIASAS
jgi:hypothetical protein